MTDPGSSAWLEGIDLAPLVWSSAAVIAAITDQAGVLLTANATFQRLAGREFHGGSILALVGEGQGEAFWAWLSAAGDGWTTRTWGVLPDEHRLPRDFRIAACRGVNGTFIVIGEPIAPDDLASGLLDVNSSLVEEQRRLGKDRNRLDKIAQEDALTGVATRRAFDEHLSRVTERAADGGAFALVMLDIDHFKALNDRYGHPAGDAVLRWLGGILRAASRRGDLVARYGGEEFVAILPEADMTAAASWAERLRCMINTDRAPAVDQTVTVSIGVTTWRAGDTASHVVERADEALYQAKRAGRDRVVIRPDGYASTTA